ncbi:MAG: glycosyltransferase family 1 protein [Rhodospirillaceae bacterium]|nr:glycosyltransferase family 1 protein [Rhodospirillaceae bacterium]
MSLAGRKILYLVSEDWYFCSHRLPIARAAQEAGAEVVVATRVREHGPKIEAEGFRLVPLELSRSGRNPIHDATILINLIHLYRREQPDIVHHVALKPALYGSIAAWLTGRPAMLNAFAGMGFIFISEGLFARAVRSFVRVAFHFLLNRRSSHVIVQNPDDFSLLTDAVGVAPERITTIKGSGVDIEQYRPRPEPDGTPIAVCVSRMLWDKGIGELVDAARELRSRGTAIRIRLVGPSDDNPAAIPTETLAAWSAQEVVDIAGPIEDIAGEFARAHIAVLPSYREGLPKSLLEAAAAGLPMVATDVPGCREVCRHEETGLLVPLKESAPLADALQTLAEDPALRARYGEAARALTETAFSESVIVSQTIKLYESVMPS